MYVELGFCTQDWAEQLSGGYRIAGRVNNAMRIQGVWLDVANIEAQMVSGYSSALDSLCFTLWEQMNGYP